MNKGRGKKATLKQAKLGLSEIVSAVASVDFVPEELELRERQQLIVHTIDCVVLAAHLDGYEYPSLAKRRKIINQMKKLKSSQPKSSAPSSKTSPPSPIQTQQTRSKGEETSEVKTLECESPLSEPCEAETFPSSSSGPLCSSGDEKEEGACIPNHPISSIIVKALIGAGKSGGGQAGIGAMMVGVEAYRLLLTSPRTRLLPKPRTEATAASAAFLLALLHSSSIHSADGVKPPNLDAM